MATQANLDRLRNLYATRADLFEFASLIQVTPENVRVFIHASRDRERDWKAWARQFSTHWTKETSASDYDYFDYECVIEGVEVSILQAEKWLEAKKPVFAEEASAA